MYKLSELAAEDFAGIYEYSLLNFGLQQAEHYTEDLESALLLLSESPRMGRDASNILAGVRRHEFENHSIFYRERASDILILRILHQNMDVIRHQFGAE